MTFTAALPTEQMDDDNNNSNIPTFKDDHLEFCTFRGAGVCLIIFAREEDNTVTEKHTHTHREEGDKTGKDARSTDAGFRTDS